MRPEPGHIAPTVRLSLFLRERGHRICYVTLPPYDMFLERLGFECVALEGVDDGNSQDLWSQPTSGWAIKRQLDVAVVDRSSSWGHLILQGVVRTAPDLVICDTCVANATGHAIVQALDRPVVALSPYMPIDPPAYRPELVLCPPEFCTPDDVSVHRDGRYYCEPSVWRDDHRSHVGQSFEWRREKPLVYCSLGTQSTNYPEARSVLKAVVAAFDGLASHQLVVAAAGRYLDVADEVLPENVRVVASVPQLLVLGQADVIITHGGLGTLKEAIMERVPCVVIPFMYDQPANGRRMEYHGIGRMCAPAECSPETIRRLVLEVAADDAMRDRVRSLSTAFWQREEECRAGHLLLDILSAHG